MRSANFETAKNVLEPIGIWSGKSLTKLCRSIPLVVLKLFGNNGIFCTVRYLSKFHKILVSMRMQADSMRFPSTRSLHGIFMESAWDRLGNALDICM